MDIMLNVCAHHQASLQGSLLTDFPHVAHPVSHIDVTVLNVTSVGRRFESLPLISVAEMRELRRENKRNLLSTRSGLGHGLND